MSASLVISVAYVVYSGHKCGYKPHLGKFCVHLVPGFHDAFLNTSPLQFKAAVRLIACASVVVSMIRRDSFPLIVSVTVMIHIVKPGRC